MRVGRGRMLGLGLAVALMALAVWQTARLAGQSYLSATATQAQTALGLTRNALAAYLARYEVTPELLADLDAIRLLAASPGDPVRRAAIDRLLALRNTAINSSDIYLMQMDGETIAASNHDRPDSFVGQNFSYRPYFDEAAEGRPSRYYALGTTSGVRGYYFSAPVRAPSGVIAAVLAVKIGVEAVEASWRNSEYLIFVTDPEGIVFMSSDPALLYAAILPLTEDRLRRTEAARRYPSTALHPLPHTVQTQGGLRLMTISGSAGAREFVATAQEMPEVGWTVHVLADSAGARAEARIAATTAALLLCAAGFALVLLWQRRARLAERQHFLTRSKQELELRVQERTADLARVNSHLEQEIAERRATEAELRATQANLVRVGKLAALGQMSAALSHEINQPLAAARNYADSAAILIDRGDLPRARENIGLILVLIDRISAIGRHLRNAARKPNEKLTEVDLPALVEETQVILGGRLAALGAVLEVDLPAGLPPVMAGAIRLQQVLVNLVSNAADAVEGQADRRIRLSARQEGVAMVLRVRDWGPGIAPSVIDRIFDPFFTTKGVGAGLGLGLSITYNIVRDFGGEISARDAGPGAEFCVRLPLDGAAARRAEAAE